MIILQLKYEIRSCNTYSRIKKLYSCAWVQLNWWPLFLVSATIAIIFETQNLPQLRQSTMMFLGIGSLTKASRRINDIPDDSSAAAAQADTQNSAAAKAVNPAKVTPVKPTSTGRNEEGQNFFLHILSDKNGD
jgi:Sec-independent protein translocase protein TatA